MEAEVTKEEEYQLLRRNRFVLYDKWLEENSSEAASRMEEHIRSLRGYNETQKAELQFYIDWASDNEIKVIIVTRVLGALLRGVHPSATTIPDCIMLTLFDEIMKSYEPVDW